MKTARFISLFQMYLFGAGIILMAAFLFAPTAKAQEADLLPQTEPQAEAAIPVVVETSAPAAPEPEPTVPRGDEIASEAPAEQAPVQVADAVADETVTDEDLGVQDATILPDNPLYGVKRFGRGLRKAFTFNKAKKIKLEIKYANQELVDAQQLVEEKGDDSESYERVAEAVGRVEDALATVKEQASEVSDAGQSAQIVQEVLDNQIKQQKVLAQIEQQVFDHAPEAIAAQVVERIQSASDQATAHAGETVGRLEQDPERLQQHFDQALQSQHGSDFKDFRNLEVLKRLEDHVPETARDAIRLAEEQTLKRFADNFQQQPDEQRPNRFENYVQHVGGDQTRHLEIFDRLKGLENLPPELAKKMELAKDIAAQRFKAQVEKIDQDFGDAGVQERMLARAFARFNQSGGPDVGKLRVLEEIKQRVQFENEAVKVEFEAKREEGIAVFKSTFTDTTSQDQVSRFAALSKKMAENPDPTTFRLLADLEEEVKADPEKRKFIERMQQEAKSQFVEQASKRGGEFFERIASSNPQDIEIFQKLKADFQKDPSKFVAPPSFGPGGFPLPPGVGPEGFGPPPFGEEGFLPPGFGPEGFGPPPFAGGPPPGFEKFFDQAIQTHTQGLGEHVQSLNNPELFQNFQQKFLQGSPDIAKEIEAQFQGNFGQIFQDKRRMIQDQSFNQAVGGEARLQIEQERGQFDAELQTRLQNAATPEEKAAIEAERQQKDQEFQNRSLDLRRQQFEQQIQFDPFCDEQCRRGEAQNFEQTLKARQGNISLPGQGPDGSGPPPFGSDGQFQPPGFDQRGPQPPTDASGQQIPDHLRQDVIQREVQKRGFDQRQRPNTQPDQSELNQIPDHLRPDVQKREAQKQKSLEQGLKPDQPFESPRGGSPGRGPIGTPRVPLPPEGLPTQSGGLPGNLPDQFRPEAIQRDVTQGIIRDQFQGEVNRQIGQQVNEQINSEILRQQGGSFGGFQPPDSGFQPPSGGFSPPPSGDAGSFGGFSPPSGGFSPPPGGFVPQGVLGNDSPTSKVINILASFFGLDRVFGAIGL